MAQKRYISTSFWDDLWVIDLTPNQKLLFMYLLTNTTTEISGIYKITVRRISFDTGLSTEDILKMLQIFEKNKKVYLFHEYIILPNWPKHQNGEKNIKVKKGIENLLKVLPSEVLAKLIEVNYMWDKEELKAFAIHNGCPMDSLSIPYIYPIDEISSPIDEIRTSQSPIKSKSKSKSQSQSQSQSKNSDLDSSTSVEDGEKEEKPNLLIGTFCNLKISSLQLETLKNLYSEDIAYKFINQLSSSVDKGKFPDLKSAFSLVNTFIIKDLENEKLRLPDGYGSKYSKPLPSQPPKICPKCKKALDSSCRCIDCKIASEFDDKKNIWTWVQFADCKTNSILSDWQKKKRGVN